MFTSPSFMFLFAILGIGIFPGANMIVSTLIALLLGFVAAGMYAFLATAMPRSGGDYVFISRIMNPPLGFTINFVLTIVNISVIGTEAVWLSTMALGPMFSGLGVIYSNSYYTSIASIFSNNLYIVTIGAIVLVALTIVMFRGTTPAFRLKSALFFIAIGTIIVYIVAIGLLPHNTAVANFDKYSSTPFANYTAIVASSKLPTSFSFGPTMFASIYAVLALSGFIISSYTGGEVRHPSKSQFVGMFGAPTIYAGLMMIMLAVTYNTLGYNFLTGISSAALSGSSSYTLPVSLPWLNFIAGYVTGNPYVLVLMTIGLMATLFAYMLTATFVSSRCLFAWTFDSVFPMRFAKVNDRYHVPTYSVAAIIAVGVAFIFLTVYTTFSAFFTYVVLASSIGLVVVGLSSILFPYLRKDVFNSAPRPVNAKIGGVPVIVLLGILGVITSCIIGYVGLLPAFVGVFSPEYVYFIIILFVIGVVIYYISYFIRKRQGVPVWQLQKEIPPE